MNEFLYGGTLLIYCSKYLCYMAVNNPQLHAAQPKSGDNTNWIVIGYYFYSTVQIFSCGMHLDLQVAHQCFTSVCIFSFGDFFFPDQKYCLKINKQVHSSYLSYSRKH